MIMLIFQNIFSFCRKLPFLRRRLRKQGSELPETCHAAVACRRVFSGLHRLLCGCVHESHPLILAVLIVALGILVIEINRAAPDCDLIGFVGFDIAVGSRLFSQSIEALRNIKDRDAVLSGDSLVIIADRIAGAVKRISA